MTGINLLAIQLGAGAKYANRVICTQITKRGMSESHSENVLGCWIIIIIMGGGLPVSESATDADIMLWAWVVAWYLSRSSKLRPVMIPHTCPGCDLK